MNKVVVILLVLFVGWALVQFPDRAATLTQEGLAAAWNFLTMVFRATIDFLSALVE